MRLQQPELTMPHRTPPHPTPTSTPIPPPSPPPPTPPPFLPLRRRQQVRPPLRGLLKVLQGSHPGNALLNMQRHLVRCAPLCMLGATPPHPGSLYTTMLAVQAQLRGSCSTTR